MVSLDHRPRNGHILHSHLAVEISHGFPTRSAAQQAAAGVQRRDLKLVFPPCKVGWTALLLFWSLHRPRLWRMPPAEVKSSSVYCARLCVRDIDRSRIQVIVYSYNLSL